MMSNPKQINVAVVGGGIGGLCVAIGLLQHKHIHVEVYEAAHKYVEISLFENTAHARADFQRLAQE